MIAGPAWTLEGRAFSRRTRCSVRHSDEPISIFSGNACFTPKSGHPSAFCRSTF